MGGGRERGEGGGGGGVDIGRKGGVWEAPGVGEMMGLSAGSAASGVAQEVAVGCCLVWGRAGTSMKKFAWRISGGVAEEGGWEGVGRGALEAAPGEPAEVVPMFRAENIADGDCHDPSPGRSYGPEGCLRLLG